MPEPPPEDESVVNLLWFTALLGFMNGQGWRPETLQKHRLKTLSVRWYILVWSEHTGVAYG